MKQLICIFILFLLSQATSTAFDYTLTKIAETNIPNGQMQISLDGKFMYVCNNLGQFAKLDIENGEVLDTMLIHVEGTYLNTRDVFVVDKSNKYLVFLYKNSNDKQFMNIYNLDNHSLIRTVDIFNRFSKDISFGGYNDITCNVYYDKFKNNILLSLSEDYSIRRRYVDAGRLLNYSIEDDSVESYFQTHSWGNTYELTTSTTKLYYSNDKKMVMIFGRFSAYDPGNYFEFSYDVLCYDSDYNLKAHHYTASEPIIINAASDGKYIYMTKAVNDFFVYRIDSNQLVYSEPNRPLEEEYFFSDNDKFYFTYAFNSNRLLVKSKIDFRTIDSIFFESNISTILLSDNHEYAYILMNNGNIFVLGHPALKVEPNIHFTCKNQVIQLNAEQQLFDYSSGNVSSRKWFVNGVELADTGRVVNFKPSQTGPYDVGLIAYINGVEYKKEIPNFFRVKIDTKADFKYIVEEFQDSIGVSFLNLSEGDSLNYKWYFGDGTTSIETNPYHYYTQNGLFHVTLIAYNKFSADTMFALYPIEFGRKSILPYTLQTNRLELESGVKVAKYKYASGLTYTGERGFQTDNGFGFIISVQDFSESSASNDRWTYYDILFHKFAAFGYFDSSPISYTERLVNTSFLAYSSTFDLNPVSNLYYLNDKLFFWKYLPEYDISYDNKLLMEEDGKYTHILLAKNKKQNFDYIDFYKTNGNVFSFVFSNSEKFADSNSMIINYNSVNFNIDTLFFNNKFDNSIQNNEQNRIFLFERDSTGYTLYQHSLTFGLVEMYQINDTSKIMFADYNNDKKKFLMVKKQLEGNNIITKLFLAGTTGIVEKEWELLFDNPKSIKFLKNLILVTGGDQVRLLVYDLDGNIVGDYYDPYVKGQISDITSLGDAKALLVGSRSRLNSEIKHIYLSSELFYMIDLAKIDTNISTNPIKTEIALKCYPNPTNGDIVIEFENMDNLPAMVTITDFMGNELSKFETKLFRNTFPAGNYGNGIYFVRVSMAGKTSIGKFIVVK